MPDGSHEQRTRRCNPGVTIPPAATEVHGIRGEDVAHEPDLGRLARGVISFLDGCDLCGFNILAYDLRLLLVEFTRHGYEFPMKGRRVIDAKTIYHKMEPRDLTAYCGMEHEGAHGAAEDVLATARILDAQALRHEALPRTIGELHDHLRDPESVDLGGMLRRDEAGAIAFARGKHKGMTLARAVIEKRDYLDWLLSADFFPDTKELVRDAIAAGG